MKYNKKVNQVINLNVEDCIKDRIPQEGNNNTSSKVNSNRYVTG